MTKARPEARQAARSGWSAAHPLHMQPVAIRPSGRRHGQNAGTAFARGAPVPSIDRSKPAMGANGRLFLLQRAGIFALAGLLVVYHTYTLFELYVGSGSDIYGGPSASGHLLYVHTQSLLRLLIIVSLVLVALNRGLAIYGMWAAIGALVATQYWAYFFDPPFPFLEGRHPLSFLKGFIIPTAITLLYRSTNSHRHLRGAALRTPGRT